MLHKKYRKFKQIEEEFNTIADQEHNRKKVKLETNQN